MSNLNKKLISVTSILKYCNRSPTIVQCVETSERTRRRDQFARYVQKKVVLIKRRVNE